MRPRPVAEAAPGGRRWFQLYCFRDEGVTRALVEEAAESGYEAIGVTVDAPRGGNRERAHRTGFEIPAELGVPGVAANGGSGRGPAPPATSALTERRSNGAHVENQATS